MMQLFSTVANLKAMLAAMSVITLATTAMAVSFKIDHLELKKNVDTGYYCNPMCKESAKEVRERFEKSLAVQANTISTGTKLNIRYRKEIRELKSLINAMNALQKKKPLSSKGKDQVLTGGAANVARWAAENNKK